MDGDGLTGKDGRRLSVNLTSKLFLGCRARFRRTFSCRRCSGYGMAGNKPRGRYTNLMPPRSTRTIDVDGVALELTIERKGVKNVNARLTGSALSVSAPRGMPQEAVDEA